MSAAAWRARCLAGGVVAVVMLASYAGAQGSKPPGFSSNEAAWLHPPGGEFPDVPGSPGAIHQDTYMVNGKQYIAFTVGAPMQQAELIALALPE